MMMMQTYYNESSQKKYTITAVEALAGVREDHLLIDHTTGYKFLLRGDEVKAMIERLVSNNYHLLPNG